MSPHNRHCFDRLKGQNQFHLGVAAQGLGHALDNGLCVFVVLVLSQPGLAKVAFEHSVIRRVSGQIG